VDVRCRSSPAFLAVLVQGSPRGKKYFGKKDEARVEEILMKWGKLRP